MGSKENQLGDYGDTQMRENGVNRRRAVKVAEI